MSLVFPPPLEVAGSYYKVETDIDVLKALGFPSPLEVIGGSYMQKTTQVALLHQVSVPFRGNWGFLLTDSAMLFGFLLSFRTLPR